MRATALALTFVIASGALAHAQPALTEPWPQGEEVSDMQQIGGATTAFLVGFGTGQAIEGRWHEAGWKFTLIDSIAAAGLFGPFIVASDCDDCGYLDGVVFGSMLAIVVSRYWQTYDAAVGPGEHNRKLYAKRRRALQPAVQPMIAPSRSGDGFVGGATLRF